VQYQVAGVLIAIGIALWGVNFLINRALGQKPDEPTMETTGGPGPIN
jgi:basic amino acid/polyamine antiporter, APA family